MGNIPFSPELKRAMLKKELWKAVLTKKQGCKYSKSKLKRLEKTLLLKDTMKLSTKETKEELKKAIKEYKKIKKEAKEKRVTFLEGRARIIAEDIGGENKIYINKSLPGKDKEKLLEG